MVFLGDIPLEAVEPISLELDRVTSGIAPFGFDVADLGVFGSKRHPGIIWAGVPDPPSALLTLQKKSALVAEAFGVSLEKRTYKPHLTLGRIKSSRNLPALTSAMTLAMNTRHGWVNVSRLLLMRSRLASDGATYSVLHKSFLKGE